MKLLKQVINSCLFRSAVCALIGFTLLIEKHPLYAGIALGIAIREFILAFKNIEGGKV
jgi:hypothetical protein